MQVELTLEEKSAAAVLAAGELAAIKAEEAAGVIVDPTEIAVLLALCNKCRPDGTEVVTWEQVVPLDPDEDEPGDEVEHIPV